MFPLQLTWRDIDPTQAIESAIRKRAEKLAQFHDHITQCRVVIEAPHQNQQKGNLYHISLELMVPGKTLVVNRGPAQHAAHSDAYVAIRDAFSAATRQLEDYARRMRGEVKQHGPSRQARVTQLFPTEDYGIVQNGNQRDIRFHRASLVDTEMEALHVGAEVWVVEEPGSQSPQAKRVSAHDPDTGN